jgi:hypothetical protein
MLDEELSAIRCWRTVGANLRGHVASNGAARTRPATNRTKSRDDRALVRGAEVMEVSLSPKAVEAIYDPIDLPVGEFRKHRK